LAAVILTAATLTPFAARAQAPLSRAVETPPYLVPTVTAGTPDPANADLYGGFLPVASLRGLVQRVLRDHPNVMAARSRMDAARYSANAALWARYPSLSASLAGPGSAGSATVQLQQPLWTAGRITGEIAASEARAVASISAVRESELALAEQLLTVLLDAMRFAELVRLADENVAAHVRLSETIARRASAGVGSQSDLGLVRSRTEQARALRSQWRAAERRSLGRFASIAGFDLATADLIRLPAGSGSGRITSLPHPLAELLARASSFSPTRSRLEAEAEAVAQDARVAGARIWPQVSLRAEHIHSRSAGTQSDTRLLAVIEYQPGAGLGALDRARAAQSLQDGAQANLARLERELNERVAADHAEASELLPRIAALEQAVAGNLDLFDSFVRQYDIGRRSWLDILNAQNEYAGTRQALAEARFAAEAAWLRISMLTGDFFQESSGAR